jgi:predicted dehydrogenase
MFELRAAVAGLGFVGRAHVEALRRLGVDVVGVLGSSQEKGQAAARELGVARAYSGLDELVVDPAVDVVHVCTPNSLHFPMVSAAMLGGKHVVCEKPLAMNSDESAELVRLGRESGQICAVCFNQRYYPLCQEARARVRAGELGEVWMVHGQYLQDWLLLPTDWSWRLDPAVGGSLRTVTGIGSHWLDMVEWLTGLAVSGVGADFATFIPQRLNPTGRIEAFPGKMRRANGVGGGSVETEDYATVLLRFDNGARGAVMLSQMCAGNKNRFLWEVNGSRASLRWDAERPNELWIGHREAPNEVMVKDPALMRADARPFTAYPGGHAEGYPDTFAQLFKEVYGYIALGDFLVRAPFPTLEDGHRQMMLAEAIQRSAVDRRWVEVAR